MRDAIRLWWTLGAWWSVSPWTVVDGSLLAVLLSANNIAASKYTGKCLWSDPVALRNSKNYENIYGDSQWCNLQA
jgi:hypothetical protein